MTTMRLKEGLEVGIFLRRLNRFMIEAKLDGRRVLVHLPNSGRLVTVLVPNARAYLRKELRSRRKSSHSLFAVEHSGLPVIVDTWFSTVAAKIALEDGQFESLRKYQVVRQNAKADHSMIDLLLKRGSQSFFLEIKSVTHAVKGVAMFPDAPTIRARRHLEVLMRLTSQGYGSGILFSVQRPDAHKIRPYHEMDPLFAESLSKAIKNGIEVFTQTLIFRPPDRVKIKPNFPAFFIDGKTDLS